MILILGEQPGHGYTGPPLTGGISGGRISDLIGQGHDGEYELANLCPVNWQKDVAEASWQSALRREDIWVTVILGRKAAAVAGLGNAEFLSWWTLSADGCHATQVGLMPHPSGLNRWWNVPRNVVGARQFMQSAFRWDERIRGRE